MNQCQQRVVKQFAAGGHAEKPRLSREAVPFGYSVNALTVNHSKEMKSLAIPER